MRLYLAKAFSVVRLPKREQCFTNLVWIEIENLQSFKGRCAGQRDVSLACRHDENLNTKEKEQQAPRTFLKNSAKVNLDTVQRLPL
jgi:hypothetical protein